MTNSSLWSGRGWHIAAKRCKGRNWNGCPVAMTGLQSGGIMIRDELPVKG